MSEHISTRYSVRIPSGVVVMDGPVRVMEPHDTLAPEDEVVTEALLREVKSTEPGSFALLPGSIDREIIAPMLDLGESPTALFNEIIEFGQTRQNNTNGLRFGQLIVHDYIGDERAEFAALKPYVGLDTTGKGYDTAAHEFSLSRYFTGAGSQQFEQRFRTFEPMGVARFSTGEYALLTKYEHGVRSLDNEVWDPAKDFKSRTVIRAIGKAAFLMGAMHSIGWTHGDAQIKNMFVSNHDEVFIADLERTMPFAHKSGSPTIDSIHEEVDRDLESLMASLTIKVDEYGTIVSEHDTIIPEDLVAMFSLIYLGIVNSPRSAVPRIIRKTPNDIRNLVTRIYES